MRSVSHREYKATTAICGVESADPDADIRRLESMILSGLSYVGVRHAIAVNSGTSGLHLLVRAFGIHDGDEVITTPFSFIASSNCILYERAKPVCVDIEWDTANIDVDLIESAITPRTKAILPVDAFGQPAKLDVIRVIADPQD